MSDFSTVQKYLRRYVAREATVDELTAYNTRTGSSNPAKSKTLGTPARDIKRIFETITLPAFTVNRLSVSHFIPRLLFQYNITLANNLYIVKVDNLSNLAEGFLCVKWRNGTKVSRYLLAGSEIVHFSFPPPGYDSQFQYFEEYTNQKIPHNFVIEFWSLFFNLGIVNIGVTAPITLTTSVLTEPSTADELNRVIAINAPIDQAGLGFNLPVELPIQQPTIVFQDNAI